MCRMSDPFEVITSSPLPRGLRRKEDGFNRQQVVNAFQQAFERIGGITRLTLWASANPNLFYPLYAKLLPSTSVTIGDNANVIIQHVIPAGPLDQHPEHPDDNSVPVSTS